MLRITVEEGDDRISLRLEGRMCGPWIGELRTSWSKARASRFGRKLVVDLRGVTFIDREGREVLLSIHREGAELLCQGCLNELIVEEIKSQYAQERGAEGPEGIGHGLARALALLWLPIALVGVNLRAADQPALRLTLRDAVQIALKQNPQVQIANLNLAESEQDRNLARAALLPQMELQTFDKVQRFNLEAFIGKTLPGSSQHAGPFETFQIGPTLSFPLLDLRLWRKYQASSHLVRAGEAQERSVREQTVLLVVSQYLGSLRAAADVQAAQSRLDLARALDEQAEDLQKNGVATGLDALRARVELQNEEQRFIEAKTEFETSLFALVRLLNLDPEQKVELADQVNFFETPAFNAEQRIDQALEHRPEWRALKAQELALVAQKKAASEARWPRLVLSGTRGFQGLSLPGSIPSYEYQATIDVPLFTGGRIRAEILKAELERKKIAQILVDLRNQIALEVKTAGAQLDSARHEVEVANQGVKLAQEALTQARDRFQAGVSNNIEVITAQDELARANDNQIRALYRYNQARADLARATGQIETLYAP